MTVFEGLKDVRDSYAPDPPYIHYCLVLLFQTNPSEYGSQLSRARILFYLFDTIASSFEIRYDGVLDGNNTPFDSIEVFGFSSKTVIRVFFLLTIDSKSEIFLMTTITSTVVLTLMFGKCFNSTNLCLSFGKEMFSLQSSITLSSVNDIS